MNIYIGNYLNPYFIVNINKKLKEVVIYKYNNFIKNQGELLLKVNYTNIIYKDKKIKSTLFYIDTLYIVTNNKLLTISDIINEEKIIYWSKKNFPVITEKDKIRYLKSFDKNNPNGIHSEMNIKKPNIIKTSYIKTTLAGLLLNNIVNKYLVIGMGGGSIVNALLKILPNINLDVVDIDNEILDVSKKYFGVIPSKNTHIYFENGIKFIKKLDISVKYDTIFLDAYDEFAEIPKGFLKNLFLKNIKKHMKLNGIFIINSFNTKIEELLKNNFKYVFYLNVYSIYKNEGNYIFFASDYTWPKTEQINKNVIFLKNKFKTVGIDIEILKNALLNNIMN
jgi:spermidine synthase